MEHLINKKFLIKSANIAKTQYQNAIKSWGKSDLDPRTLTNAVDRQKALALEKARKKYLQQVRYEQARKLRRMEAAKLDSISALN